MNIDWPNKLITVFNTDTFMTFTGGNVYEMDTNAFRLAVLAEEDDLLGGMAYPKVFNHNTTVLLGGIEYARIIEVINGYTITFDDGGGAYVVDLNGSNNNILDVTNLTTVQIRSNNSAGLINIREIQQDIFSEGVTVDQTNVTGLALPGVQYPAGTSLQPVNNIPDAITIAGVRGFSILYIKGSLTLDTGDDVSGKILIGENAAKTSVTINTGSNTLGCEVREAYVTGTLDGGTVLRNCLIDNLNYINGFVFQCLLNPGTISLGGSQTAYFLNSYSGQPGVGTPTLDCDGLSNTADTPLAFRNYSGGIELTQLTGGANVSIDFSSGQLKINPSCTSGTIVARGPAKVTNSVTGANMHSGTYFGGLTVVNETVQGDHIHDLWADQGLDPDRPLEIDEDGTRRFGGETVDAVTSGTSPNRTTTLTRQ